MTKKNLLIDEYPLLVLPSLATAIGLNEAIALQQLHYWLGNPKGGVEIDGERWTYNTYEEWQEDNFPFWSVRTVQRVFLNLEELGLIISKQEASYDRKKYYRVHYANLARWNTPNPDIASGQDGTMDDDKVAYSIKGITETTPETTNPAAVAATPEIPSTYSVDWQMAGGLETIIIPDEAEEFRRAAKSWAYQIAMNNADLEPLAYEFMISANKIPCDKDVKFWRKTLRGFRNNSTRPATAQDVHHAILMHISRQLPIKSPASIEWALIEWISPTPESKNLPKGIEAGRVFLEAHGVNTNG